MTTKRKERTLQPSKLNVIAPQKGIGNWLGESGGKGGPEQRRDQGEGSPAAEVCATRRL